MDKIRLREQVKSQLAALPPAYLRESDEKIFHLLCSLPEFERAERVFTYISIDREVDTRRIIALCHELGKIPVLPYRYNKGQMGFTALDRPLSALSPGVFGIPMPDESLPELFPEAGDLMLVPALCFDEDGYRLGHGGGYYDRYLAAHPVFSIGLCREALLSPQLFRETHDRAVDCLITDKKIARPVKGPAKIS